MPHSRMSRTFRILEYPRRLQKDLSYYLNDRTSAQERTRKKSILFEGRRGLRIDYGFNPRAAAAMPPRACPRAKTEFLVVVVVFLILHTCSIDQNPVVDNTQPVLDRRFSFETFPTKTLDATHGFV